MQVEALRAFSEELSKLGTKRDITALLASRARRVGIDPSSLPSIRQVGNVVATGNRQRAAEIAQNVRGFLREPKPA